MANLSAVVQQLKKERTNAQRVVDRLVAALKALRHLDAGNSVSRPRRKMSAAAGRKIAAAQRARWAKVKKQKAACNVGDLASLASMRMAVEAQPGLVQPVHSMPPLDKRPNLSFSC
jgi:hypothetical protein